MLCELISLYSPFHCQGNRYWLTWVDAFLLVELLFDLHLSSSLKLKYFAAMCISILLVPSNLGPLSVTFLTCVWAKCRLGGLNITPRWMAKSFWLASNASLWWYVYTEILWSRWFKGSMSASVHHSGHQGCTCSGSSPHLLLEHMSWGGETWLDRIPIWLGKKWVGEWDPD